MTTPTRMDRRPSIPRNATLPRMIAPSVMSAVTGASLTFAHAVGARLKPMSATIVPVTIGGITTSIHRAPAKWTSSPMSASSTPVITTPPRATDSPPEAIAAVIGAMNAKLEPR